MEGRKKIVGRGMKEREQGKERRREGMRKKEMETVLEKQKEEESLLKGRQDTYIWNEREG